MNRLANNPEQRHLFRELVAQIFSQLPAALYATLLLSTLMVLVLWNLFPSGILFTWLGVVWTIIAFRFVLYYVHRGFAGQRLTQERWLTLYSISAQMSGVAWGLAPILFCSPESPQTNVFIAFVLGGLIAGAAGSMAALKVTMRIFTALLCVPVIVIFVLYGDNLHLVMGLMMAIFGGAYLVLSSNMGRMIVNSLTLRHENSHEIEERRKAETELRLIKEDLEQTVNLRTGQLEAANDELSREIAERLQAEARLRESEERFRSLVESSSDWIWEVDREGVYTYSSPSVSSILGYSPQDVVGRAFYEFMPPEEAERTRATFDSNRASGLPFVGLVNRSLHRDGREVVMETSGEPILDSDGELVGFRGIDREITMRVRHEEETRKVEHLQSLGLLAGGIAHDFNNLLTAIFGNIELASLDLEEGSRAAKSLEEAVAAMEQARKLTGQLLTFSKGGSPVLQTTSIRDLILNTCDFSLSGSAIRCEYDLADDLWPAVVDSGQIWQVLNNLLTNAREAMPDGGTVQVAAANVLLGEDSPLALPGGGYIRVSVKDQGRGIGKADLLRVFNPYFSTKRLGAEKGTGIGLAVCHSVIEKHKGHISVESSPGEGTTVVFHLPASSAAAGDHGADEAAIRPAPVVCRVLLLEDDESVISTTTRILDRLGHTVVLARNGAEAIEAQSRAKETEEPFDLLLLDLTIRGGMGGREAVGKLKAIDPDVIAVVTSGYADDPVIANCRDFGFDASLIKPFNLNTLRSLIEDLVQDRSS